MANNVYANGREVSCKSASGKTVAAFPDVCFTPPEAPPPGIPIPYPNTGFASDTTAGSKSVQITGKEVMLKNKSYFKKSTGDEAGCAAKKGLLTSVNTGKVYFTVWSMNVKIEGENVVRHLDLTTHNHASQPGNTPPWVYADKGAVGKACAEEIKAAKKHCEPSNKEKKEFKDDQDRANKRRKKKGKRAQAVRPMGWKDAHCKGLMRVKPYTDLKGIQGAIQEQIDDVMDKIANLDDLLYEKGIEIAKSKATKVAARAGAKYVGSLFGGPLAPFLAAASTVVSVVDGAYSTVTGAMEAYDAYKEISGQIGNFQEAFSKAQQQLSKVKEGVGLLDKVKNGQPLTAAEQAKLDKLKKEAADMGRNMANAQAAQAMADPCLRALKCLLTPYNQKSGMGTTGNKPQQEGCCPGQTGHHIPPKSYFKDCPDYKEGNALVVCAEGVDQRSGSHGRLHDAQDKAATKMMGADGSLSHNDAIKAAAKAHKEVFGLSSCSTGCIYEQLKASLDKCKNSKINAVNKEGGALGKDAATTQTSGF
ncbi:MAG: PAAR-like domain-containing protein [Pirellulaceae bacterium]